MVRINCHSAFKHYEMFHSNHCGGSNYGSIFNTTYNISCGNNGNHGGFWSGFGAGLGNAFGGLFTNMFGGMNFGGMSLWGGGMMPWGGATMPWFNSIGNNGGWWSNNANNNNTNNTNNDSSNSPVDKDNAKYNELEKDVNELLKKAEDNDSKKEAKKLYDEIKELYEKPLDPMNKKMNKGAYHDLMTTLENKFPELKEGTDAGKDKKADNDGKAKMPTTEKQEVAASAKPENAAAAKKAKEAKKAAEEAAEKLKNANSMDDLLGVDYDKLSDADKKNYQNKMRDFVNKMNASDLKAKLANLDDAKRKLVLESIYDGAKNITEENFDQFVKEGATINVIDHSPEMQDFLNAKITSVNNTTITITINTKSGTLTIPYNKDASKYGEMIFHGAKGNTQKYALQIKDNVLYLNQYKYHDGYKEPDIDDKNRDQYKNNTKAKK